MIDTIIQIGCPKKYFENMWDVKKGEWKHRVNGKGILRYMTEERELHWGMHFCNPRMSKTIVKVEMYISGLKEKKTISSVHSDNHTKYYMTEQGQIFKFDKESFISYELDQQKMVWFENQNFVELYIDGDVRCTEMRLFGDYFELRKEEILV